MMFTKKEGSHMKTSSKLYFVLGALATIGTMTLVYCAIQDTDKSPKELLEDSKKLIKKSIKKGERLANEISDSIEKETKTLVQDASDLV